MRSQITRLSPTTLAAKLSPKTTKIPHAHIMSVTCPASFSTFYASKDSAMPKADVDTHKLSSREVEELALRFGAITKVLSSTRLYGGFSGSNYRIEHPGGTHVLKLCHGYPREDVVSLCEALLHVQVEDTRVYSSLWVSVCLVLLHEHGQECRVASVLFRICRDWSLTHTNTQ